MAASGIGVHHMWGLSPALDVLEAADDPSVEGEEAPPYRILLLRCGDLRHVLKTIAYRHRHARRPLHFYVYEHPAEVLARNLLQLAMFTDWAVPLRVRAHAWLEVYGNALLQERTAEYVHQKGRELIRTVSGDADATLQDVICMDALKYSQRDELCKAFESWDTRVQFDVHRLLDQRLRAHYKERYDFRRNLIDWDYQMRLRPHASIVHPVLYREWRETGVAFAFGDQRYTEPNRTMATYAEGRERGVSVARRGFWADITSPPYFALGTHCEAGAASAAHKQLFEIHAKGTGAEQHRHNCVEVSVFNVLSLMCEAEGAGAYVMRTAHEIYSGLGQGEGEGHGQGPSGRLSRTGEDAPDAAAGAAATAVAGADGASGRGPGADAATEAAVSSAADPDSARLGEAGALEGAAVSTAGSDGAAAGAPVAGSEPSDAEQKLQLKRAWDARRRARHIVRTFTDVKLFPVTGPLDALYRRGALAQRFDRVVVGAVGAQEAGSAGLARVLRPGALVTVELARHVVPLSDEQRQQFAGRVHEQATKAGWCLVASDAADLVRPGAAAPAASGAGADAPAGPSQEQVAKAALAATQLTYRAPAAAPADAAGAT